MAMEVLLLFFGQFAASTAVLMIKASAIDPVLLASYRMLGGALLLLPLYLRARRRVRESGSGPKQRHSSLDWLLPGIFLALHFITWNMGARMTIAANASLIVNMVPLAMPVFVLFMYGTRLSSREVLGTVLALSGIVVLSVGDLEVSRSNLPGDMVSLFSMVMLTVYMGLARRRRPGSIWLYVVPLYAVGGLAALVGSLFITPPWVQEYAAIELLWVFLISAFPTLVGHSVVNRAMGILPTQLVSLSMLSQFVFAGLLAYPIYGEVPHLMFIPASMLIFTGAWVVVRQRPRNLEVVR